MDASDRTHDIFAQLGSGIFQYSHGCLRHRGSFQSTLRPQCLTGVRDSFQPQHAAVCNGRSRSLAPSTTPLSAPHSAGRLDRLAMRRSGALASMVPGSANDALAVRNICSSEGNHPDVCCDSLDHITGSGPLLRKVWTVNNPSARSSTNKGPILCSMMTWYGIR